ncbi:MAG: helix-turn-helix transcriptional regulator [Candidatus Omnitrophica bacterium]|nr:helix-turn-helix transcriptional regulator [Candidatus Omnitrophota bacterium]
MRKCRLEKGLRQVDLAKRLGVDEMTIVNWEKDRTRPVKRYRNRLKYLGIKS